jgi:putative ABC transport system permease protein
MKTWVIIKVALKSLVRNKMRTFLTMLGIIIGVGAVVGMISITDGAKKTIIDSIQAMGNNAMYISSINRTRGGVSAGMGGVSTLGPQDAFAIAENCRNVDSATPSITRQARVIYRDRNWLTSISGGNEHLGHIGAWEMEDGYFFTSADVTSGAKVCVVGQIVVDNLFNYGDDPIGKTIRINRMPFRIVGVLKAKGISSGSQEQDDVVMMPYTTMMQRMCKDTKINMIMASAVNQQAIPDAVEEITTLLRQRHRVKPSEPDFFQIFTQDEIIEMINSYTRTLSLLLAAVASVSLLVGGIGIMNIMLVAVNERIREIGIRMALGAKRRDIMSQFLIESVTLAGVGGILGILTGYLFGKIGGKLMQTGNIVISPASVVIALLFASGIGIFFGLYPAWKASNLDPIEALRHE